MKHRHRETAEMTHQPRQPRCLATLEPLEEEGLSATGQRDLSGGRGQFPSHVDFSRSDMAAQTMEHMQHMSISGMQDKISLRLERNSLFPVDRDGSHILKPIPATNFKMVGDVPANEHVTMLAAKHLGIKVAACGLVRTSDDELAYITRRFDRQADGSRLKQEDFGSLAGMSADITGKAWKYDYSYEGIGRLVVKHCSAQQRDLQEFFRRVVFCYIIGNGDAHVRNFSVLRGDASLVQLSPAYDLLCTPVHIHNDSNLAMPLLNSEKEGGFSKSYEALGFYTRSDFLALAGAIGMNQTGAGKICDELSSDRAAEIIDDLVRRSFLTDEAQESYLHTVTENISKFRKSINF
jgi:serine/threonine-protein kinase HipA